MSKVVLFLPASNLKRRVWYIHISRFEERLNKDLILRFNYFPKFVLAGFREYEVWSNEVICT